VDTGTGTGLTALAGIRLTAFTGTGLTALAGIRLTAFTGTGFAGMRLNIFAGTGLSAFTAKEKKPQHNNIQIRNIIKIYTVKEFWCTLSTTLIVALRIKHANRNYHYSTLLRPKSRYIWTAKKS
jgi:hypothetical protein